MVDLTTTYAGLKLKSPIIAASSSLTASPAKIKTFAEAGAGAVILKSIFEEQIQNEAVDTTISHTTSLRPTITSRSTPRSTRSVSMCSWYVR